VNRTLPAVTLLALAAVLAIAGCGSSSSNSSSSSAEGGAYGSGGGSAASTQSTTGSSAAGGYGSGASSASTGAAAVVSVGSAPKVGQVLVDSKGMTLYYFEKDKKGGGKSNCSSSCAGVWPPLTTSGAAKAMGGAEASQTGTIKRSDGTSQVTYAGWPLYTYSADAKPGEANGTDVKSFGGAWYPLHPNGEKAGH
jgi:predicted lipoprotein with Yx(FWY)xxD motif